MKPIAALLPTVKRRTPADPPAVYQPPTGPLHEWTEEQLQAAVAHCSECSGLGYYKLDVPVRHSDFGRLFKCPICGQYSVELHRRSVLALMQPSIDRYSLLRGELLEKSFANFEQDDDDTRATYAAVRAWALGVLHKNDALPWLCVCGGTGCGKTHLAAAAANALTKQGVSLIFATAPEILGMLKRDRFKEMEPLIDALQRIPVLILDDLGAESATDWVREVLFRLVDGRGVNALPTLYVSNHPLRGSYSADTLLDRLGARIVSRLSDHARCTVVTNAGRDRRLR